MGGMKLSQSGIWRVSDAPRASVGVGVGVLAVVMVRSRVAVCARGMSLWV